ncbi:MAG: DUF4244 domain-containing protein [Bifidobacteriaceae bacterium]|jgi:hypothetical protein|nr:DUF4244 domain-containing protein [Bifidobacteriaceae bacterium]
MFKKANEFMIKGMVTAHSLSYALRNRAVNDAERGLATVEYAVVTVAAAGLAGLLIVILKSDEVRNALMEVITSAFKTDGE